MFYHKLFLTFMIVVTTTEPIRIHALENVSYGVNYNAIKAEKIKNKLVRLKRTLLFHRLAGAGVLLGSVIFGLARGIEWYYDIKNPHEYITPLPISMFFLTECFLYHVKDNNLEAEIQELEEELAVLEANG